MEHEGQRYLVIGYAPRRPASFSDLTTSEFEVIEQWIEGASMKAIAARRKVALRTIANQIASAYAKLDVSSRTELLVLIRDDGGKDR